MVEETLLHALQDARTKETARLEALFNVQDLRSLRLMNLHDMIEPELAKNALAKPLFNLNLEPGEIPRLWLGLTSSIVMEPDPKTYRLVNMSQATRETLFETTDMMAMKAFALRHMAFQIVEQRRKPSRIATLKQNSIFPLALTWLVGVVCGIAGLSLCDFIINR
ncbi:MAG: hypothetical protein ABI230_07545 [Aestuariivirga sp.]